MVVGPFSLAGLGAVPSITRRHVRLHADDRLDPFIFGELVEGPGAKEAAVVGEGKAGHLVLFGPVDEIGQPVGSVEERVFGVGVEVDEAHECRAKSSVEMRNRPFGRSEKAYGFPILHTSATTAKREGARMAYPSGLGSEDSAIGERCLLYSITHVYLFPELHLGEASIPKAVRPRIVSDVTSVTPRVKGDPPQ